ncbi:hypothetical protein SO802_022558 [Lithocarpus litseifolius]|uniref:Endoplasmic reticulum transmembrane protein n=1 Tax=Lithocarpus litseifolius TaxID=425828 RepID=A0AAW2C3J8_9ROSI
MQTAIQTPILFHGFQKIGPLRELVIKSLDQLKTGKGPATVKTIAGTMSVILLSSLMSIVKIQNKGAKLGTMSPMDQVLWRTHLLEASLMGLRSSMGASKEEVERLQKEKTELKEKEEKASKEIKRLQEEIASLSENLKKVKLE